MPNIDTANKNITFGPSPSGGGGGGGSGRFNPSAISVPASFARALAKWKGASFELVMNTVELNMSGKMLKQRSGRSISNVKKRSKELPTGFRIETNMPSLIAWMQGSPRKAYTVVPRKKKVLSWIDKATGQRIFARRSRIPAWKFHPQRPVFDDAVNSNKLQMQRIFEREILKALADVFPDTRVVWRIGK